MQSSTNVDFVAWPGLVLFKEPISFSPKGSSPIDSDICWHRSNAYKGNFRKRWKFPQQTNSHRNAKLRNCSQCTQLTQSACILSFPTCFLRLLANSYENLKPTSSRNQTRKKIKRVVFFPVLTKTTKPSQRLNCYEYPMNFFLAHKPKRNWALDSLCKKHFVDKMLLLVK